MDLVTVCKEIKSIDGYLPPVGLRTVNDDASLTSRIPLEATLKNFPQHRKRGLIVNSTEKAGFDKSEFS